MRKPVACALAALLTLLGLSVNPFTARAAKVRLQVGVAAIAITPFGKNPDWDGTITESGIWGEPFTDTNHNGRWDTGEPFTDDAGNDALDPSSKGKYDGIYLAGFGKNRMATAMHDDYWARAIVIEHGTTRVAIVSVDLIGYYAKANYYGLGEVQKLIDPKAGLSEILLTSTHNHAGPDTIGAWGANALSDGKYPKYLRFIDRQIAKAVNQAVASLKPAAMLLGVTTPKESPAIAGMQTRTHGRPPDFFDEELRVMQFYDGTRARFDRVLATLINWNTHPESMESRNTVMTSDFPNAVRASIEKKYGGTAIYVSGDIGAVEIIGDSNIKPTDRVKFDDKEFPAQAGSNRPLYTFDRTEAIGRDVAKAAVEAIDHGQFTQVASIDIKKAVMRVPMDNQGYLFLAGKGVLDTMPPPRAGEKTEFDATIYAITIGDAQIITTPGELFPEVFYGVAKNKRNDCPDADTKRAIEPSVRDKMTKKFKFVFGLCPDEFGYMVPGYDFLPPTIGMDGPKEAKDPCKSKGVTDHYHETNSASSQLAPAWACIAGALLEGKSPEAAGCSQWMPRTEPAKTTNPSQQEK